MEKNSFVFHFVYLHDIPEELRGQWALFIIDYAESGKEPELTSWTERKLWNSIKDRINADSESYTKKVEYQKEYKERKKREKNGTFGTIQNIPNNSETSKTSGIFQNFQNIPTQCESDSVSESVSDSVFDSESVSVSVSEYVSVSDSEKKKSFGSAYAEPKPKQKKTKKTEQIQKPTINEVAEYCREMNYTFSPEKFWSYYEQNSWGVRFFNESGKCIRFVPVKDWKSKCKEWQERQVDFSPPSKSQISNNQNVSEYENYFLNQGLEHGDQDNSIPNF